MLTNAFLVCAGVLALTGCRASPSVATQPQSDGVGVLAGQWDGQIMDNASGRAGVITFTITPGKDTAFGDVLLTPEPGMPPVQAADAGPEHLRHAHGPEELRVAFVRMPSGAFEGTLEPWVSRDCQCAMTTVFRGTMRSNTIDGEYVSSNDNLRRTGAWQVRRSTIAAR